MLKNVPTIQIQKVATFKSDRRKSIYSQTFIFQMLQLVGLVAIKTLIFCRELSFFVNTPFKESIRVILSDPPCEDDNARFTTVPVKVRHLQFSTAEKTYFQMLTLFKLYRSIIH